MNSYASLSRCCQTSVTRFLAVEIRSGVAIHILLFLHFPAHQWPPPQKIRVFGIVRSEPTNTRKIVAHFSVPLRYAMLKKANPESRVRET